MISLRKHIDNHQDALTKSALAAFRSALIAMGECGSKAVPGAGADLPQTLACIEGLSQPVTPDSLDTATKQVARELSLWADRAFHNHTENERELREIMAAVAKAAESLGDRDARLTSAVGSLTGKLRGIADINDLAAIRRSIIEETAALKVCVDLMAEENKLSVQELTTQVTEYRVRLEKSERESVIDPLTGLANRRAFERRLESHVERVQPFCLILIDLDDFKGVNDRHGHVAGDDLLRGFSSELKAQFRPMDLVCRWGGDEFAALIVGDLAAGEAAVERIRRWALGEYKIETGAGQVKVQARASIGVVAWKAPETGTELLARADKSVYRAKASAKVSVKAAG